MTDYITIHGIKKRSFVIQAKLPKLSNSEMVRFNAMDIRVTRSGDIRVTRNGDIRANNNTNNCYPRVISGVKKRSFLITAKVKHG